MGIRAESLSLVGRKIYEIRKKKKLSLKELAAKAEVTAGLLSKIENFKAMASLPVLYSISRALEVDLAELVLELTYYTNEPYTVIRASERKNDEISSSDNVSNELILDDEFKGVGAKASILTINPGGKRKTMLTNYQELVYVISGSIKYTLEEDVVELNAGDTIYFDGGIQHSWNNEGKVPAVGFRLTFTKKD